MTAAAAHPNLVFDAGRHFVALCDLAARDPEVDLIVWPETSYPPVWKETAPGVAAAFVRRACELCPVPWIEALAVMGQVNPFFERALSPSCVNTPTS